MSRCSDQLSTVPTLTDIFPKPGLFDKVKRYNCTFTRMQALIDMASSPQYLAQSAHTRADSNTVSLPDGSCPRGLPSTCAYPDPDEGSYSTISPFSSPNVVDDNLLTPVSSAASPPLQHRPSKLQSPYQQSQDLAPCSQQPTPPNTSTMYTYPEYLSTTQASSPMAVQTVVAQAQPGMLGDYLQHSPGHEDSLPPPQETPYFGHYSASGVSVGQDHDGLQSYQTYLSNAMTDNSYGLMERPSLPDINGSSYHRPLAPSTHAPMAPIMEQTPSGSYHREVMPLARLSPQSYSRGPLLVKRHATRKPRARKGVKKEPASPLLPQPMGPGGRTDTSGPADEVTLDEKTPGDLRRLWEIRMKWQKKKGHGMWDDIVREYKGREADGLSDDKRTQVKANLQMKIHRGVMKHGSWPERDRAALLRAYQRWEEMRYTEIHRLFQEEIALQGRQSAAYEWRTNNIEAKLVKEGLEEKEREPSSKARRRRVYVPARHVLRGGASGAAANSRTTPQAPQQQKLPTMYNVGGYDGFPGVQYGAHHYGGQGAPQQQQQQQQQRREVSATPSYAMLVEQLGSQPQHLTEEQHDRLMAECLERAPFEPSPDSDAEEDVRMGGAGGSDYPEEHLPRSRPQSQSSALPPAINGMMASSLSPDINAQRSEVLARQACGEMLKQPGQQQHHHHAGHQFAGV